MNSILLQNKRQVKKDLDKNINYVDLRYSGPDSDGQIKLTGGSPVLNRYKIWLQSGKNSYLRRPNFGGFFSYNLNNYPFTPESEKLIEEDLIEETKSIFPSLLVISCKVTCDLPARKWNVELCVADRNTGLAALDVKDGDKISFSLDGQAN